MTLCIFIGTLGTSTASAASGASALPPEPTAFEKYMYSTYAPASQTTYKLMTTVTQSVDNVKKDGEDLILFGNDVVMGATAMAAIVTASKIPLKSHILTGITVVGGIGAGTCFLGRSMIGSVSDFKSGTKIKHEVHFKWTDPKKFEYSVQIKTWSEYKGTIISAVKTSYFNKSL